MSDSRPKLTRRLADRLVSPYVGGLASQMSQIQTSIADLHQRLDWIEAEIREIPPREERIKALLDERADEVAGAVAATEAGLAELATGTRTEVLAELAGLSASSSVSHEMLRAVYEKGDEQRLRLYELRRSAEYEAAFTENEPLVSVVIPTYSRFELLRDRSLPAILGQNYRNIEVIVSGDHAVPEIEQVVRECDDPRVRYIDRTINGP
jgi:hypothetical protein